MNLRKAEDMDIGTIGFKEECFRKIIRNVQKDKEIVKMLEKTREEKAVDYRQEREQRDAEERARRKKFLEQEKQREKEEEKKKAADKELKSYATLQNLAKSANTDASKTGSIEE